jgi:hypothetical protein
MIVNYIESGWQIITQRAHGLLAAQICAQWSKKNQPKRWLETLIATAEHDDIYNEFENTDLLSEKGGPVNFKMNSFKENYCKGLMGMAITKSLYIALLTSRHIRFVYGDDPEAVAYCRNLEIEEKKWLKEYQFKKEDIDASYQLLEFCDAFSLLICQNLIQPEHRKLEISNGPDNVFYSLSFNSKMELFVDPWPFEVEQFTVIYESRSLDQLVFKDNKSFKISLSSASVTSHNLIITKKM